MLYGPQLLLIIVLMAGLQRVSCSAPAVFCVYRRELPIFSHGHRAATLKASVWTCAEPFYWGLRKIVKSRST